MFDSHHPQKGPFVRALQPGERVVAFYLVRRKQMEIFRDKTRGEYLTLSLGDRSGEILARVWERAQELSGDFSQGDVIKVAADVEIYRDRAQLIVRKLRFAREGEFDMRDMQPAAEKDTSEMQAELQRLLASIEKAHLSALLQHFFTDADVLSSFSTAPAARKIHHAYLGGLLEHTLEVAALAEALLRVYPEIDRDMLLTGVLLHDIGKIREFTWESDIDQSDEGRLLGHVVISGQMVEAAIAQLPYFPGELRLRLQHMIVSHHGRHEWGSPRRPKTLEAIALHHLEGLDAQVNRFRDLLRERREPEQNWTDYNRLLDRKLYAGQGELSIEEAGH
jgi:3'-5' exoribonuclease